jgi:hypothetical protein
VSWRLALFKNRCDFSVLLRTTLYPDASVQLPSIVQSKVAVHSQSEKSTEDE